MSLDNRIDHIRENEDRILSRIIESPIGSTFDAVNISESSDVHFGNRTYIYGPVTIQQSIQEEQERKEAENSRSTAEVPSNLDSKISDSSFFKLSWKYTIAALIFAFVTILFIILAVLLSADTLEDMDTNNDGGHNTTNDTTALGHADIIPRSFWTNINPELTWMNTPVGYVVISHTVTDECLELSQCVRSLRSIQNYHIETCKWTDIGYNFLIGGNGTVFEGRGWNRQGAHTKPYNKISLGIAFIGRFDKKSPTNREIESLKRLLKIGVDMKKIKPDFKIVTYYSLSTEKGDTLFNKLKREFPNFEGTAKKKLDGS